MNFTRATTVGLIALVGVFGLSQQAWAPPDPQPKPAIHIEKATNGVDADDADAGDAPQIKPGDRVTWTYKVENTGNVELVNVMAFDDTLRKTLNCPKTELVPGESMADGRRGQALHFWF